MYNNGLTALVNEYKFNRDKTKITVEGISVVNGAQTTGAIGNLEGDIGENAMVQIRFVKTGDDDLIHGIVRYNNSQNRVTSADFRSNDKIQRRLRTQFQEQYPELTYYGGRRGGSDDAIGRPKHVIPSDTAAQALTAFHGRPGLAYFSKGKIWEDNDKYDRVFKEDLGAPHLVFVIALLRSVESHKNQLRARSGGLTEAEEKELEFFMQRGSIFLMMSAMARCLEVFCGRKLGNLFRLHFRKGKKLDQVHRFWDPIVAASVSLAPFLKPAIEARLKDAEVEAAIGTFASLVAHTRSANKSVYDEFSKLVLDK